MRGAMPQAGVLLQKTYEPSAGPDCECNGKAHSVQWKVYSKLSIARSAVGENLMLVFLLKSYDEPWNCSLRTQNDLVQRTAARRALES